MELYCSEYALCSKGLDCGASVPVMDGEGVLVLSKAAALEHERTRGVAADDERMDS